MSKELNRGVFKEVLGDLLQGYNDESLDSVFNVISTSVLVINNSKEYLKNQPRALSLGFMSGAIRSITERFGFIDDMETVSGVAMYLTLGFLFRVTPPETIPMMQKINELFASHDLDVEYGYETGVAKALAAPLHVAR